MIAGVIAGGRPYSASGAPAIPTAGLITRYTMGHISGATLIDEMGNHDGTIIGATTSTGPTGASLYFTTASTTYIETNEKFDFIHKTGMFSFNCWLKADTYDDGSGYVFAGSTVTNSEIGSFFLYEDRSVASADKKIVATLFNGVPADPAPPATCGTNDTQPVSGWALITVEGDGTTVRIYKNNVAVSSATIGTLSASSATRTMRIGVANYSSRILPWKGYIGETLIYDRALTDTERGAIYSAGV